MTPEPQQQRATRHWVFAAICLLLVALNLRSVISAVSPVLPDIQAELGLSAGSAGFALTLTVLCFGIGALICPLLLRGLRPATLLTVGVVVLMVGGLGRALLPGAPAFFLGTVAIGAGVAVGNVVVPVIIRLNFADRVPLMTACYSVILSSGSVFAAGLTLPFMHLVGGGWRIGQLPWVGLVAVTLLVWAAALATRVVTSRQAGPSGGGVRDLLRTPLAWCVTAVMGLQSMVFYAFLSWGPSVMTDAGIDPTTAGLLVSLLSIVAVTTNLLGPVVVRGRRTVPGLVGMAVCYVVGLALVPWGLVPAVIGVCILGLGVGATLPYALTLIATAFPLRLTGAMSSMAQGFGYLLAGLGPWLFGALHEFDPSWRISLAFTAVGGVAFTVVALVARRLGRADPPAAAPPVLR